MGTLTHRPSSPLHSHSFFMANVSSTSVAAYTTCVYTPSSIGGGTISNSNISASMIAVSSTSILGLSWGIQPSSPSTDHFHFGIPSSGIPLVSSTLPSTSSVYINSMVSGSTSLQGFTFGSGHVPPSNPSLNVGAMPFSSYAQNINPFQWR